MHRAHAQDIVYGDRWGPNEIITEDGDLLRIDLDFQLLGPYAREFELAQTVYHTVYFSHVEKRKLVIAILQSLLGSDRLQMLYNQDVLRDLLRGHVGILREVSMSVCRHQW